MPRKTFTFEGKRYDVTAKTEAELYAKIALKKRDLEEGRIAITKNMLIQAWSKEWLESYKRSTVEVDWYKGVVSIVCSKIVPEIGNMRLAQVKQIHIQKLLNVYSSYSSSYITKIYNILHEMFETAKMNNLIPLNPVSGIKKPKGAREESRRSITAQERKYILSLAKKHRGGIFYEFMLYCGLRPGEVAALQWRHINLKKKFIRIENATKASGQVGAPKSKAGVRIVFIPDIFLSDLIAIQGEPFEYVCTQACGKRHTRSSMKQLWESFKYQLNIEMGCKTFKGGLIPPYPVAEDLVPYCLRHTYCTDLQAAGVPINVARELMGHEDISTTAKIYTHSSDEATSDAADAVNRLYQRREHDKSESIEI